METKEKVCCGKPMISLGDVQMLSNVSSEIDTCYRWVCLECGGFEEFTTGQLDMEILANDIENFGSETDKRKFIELHPEFSDQISN
jgi:hypothetical protein